VTDTVDNFEALKAALERDKVRTADDRRARGLGELEPTGDLTISVREIAVRALVAQHGVDRDAAFRMLAQAEQERQDQAERDAQHPHERIARENELRAQRETQRLIRAVGEIGIPVRPEIVAALVNGTGLVTKPAQDAHRWLGTPKRVLALLGDMGTGKTVAACAIALASLRARQSVAYVRETDVIRWARSSALASEEKLARLSEVSLLIIDELDQALAQDAEQASVAIAQVVDVRVRSGRTVLVGNLTVEAFVRRYGRRCADRIREIGETQEYRAKSLRAPMVTT
jgi:DNA replication protein DnaC